MIFQTGRINLKVIRKAVNLGPEAHPALELESLAAPEDDRTPRPRQLPKRENGASKGSPSRVDLRTRSRTKDVQSEEEDGEDSAEDEDVDRSAKPLLHLSSGEEEGAATKVVKLLTTYALIVVYIVFDAGRTIILQKSLSTTVINSTSLTLVCFVCGVIVASGMTFYTHGEEGLRRAWRLGKILHCLPAAFMFALATALGNLAFANGITPSLYVVLGKFYTPVAAIGSRWVMGKFYMWLEWFALLILTLSSVCFGYLHSFSGTEADGNTAKAPIAGMLLVLASAATSAMAGLVTEKILKGEQVPFHMQKVRLDAGSILSSTVLLPAIGLIATRPQDVMWAERPQSYKACPWSSSCWDMEGRQGYELLWAAGNATCGNPTCSCECSSGVWAGWDIGWDAWVLVLAVFINVSQGWVAGQVTKRFSVIHRAIADSFSLLAIYFIGDPIFNHTSLGNVTLNLVAFIVPTSTALFSVATSEMQKVFLAESKLRGRRRSLNSERLESEFDSDSDSEYSEYSTGTGRISRHNTPPREAT
mmetsp:Transcript_43227/g.97478  ORF Transcript_43227/g.97478 Transcript_43227/m.97478 type:complete len:532 (-) Transcript_43227:50-1645(-)